MASPENDKGKQRDDTRRPSGNVKQDENDHNAAEDVNLNHSNHLPPSHQGIQRHIEHGEPLRREYSFNTTLEGGTRDVTSLNGAFKIADHFFDPPRTGDARDRTVKVEDQFFRSQRTRSKMHLNPTRPSGTLAANDHIPISQTGIIHHGDPCEVSPNVFVDAELPVSLGNLSLNDKSHRLPPLPEEEVLSEPMLKATIESTPTSPISPGTPTLHHMIGRPTLPEEQDFLKLCYKLAKEKKEGSIPEASSFTGRPHDSRVRFFLPPTSRTDVLTSKVPDLPCTPLPLLYPH